MLPVVFNPATIAVGLAGAGEGMTRRQVLLERAGVNVRSVPAKASQGALSGLHMLFVAGLGREASFRLVQLARRMGILVNVEDVPEWCDFHVPAVVRRGDLLLTVSTGGKAPGLSRIVREWLEDHFGVEWTARLDDLGSARANWRKEGFAPSDISHKTRDLVSRKGWLS